MAPDPAHLPMACRADPARDTAQKCGGPFSGRTGAGSGLPQGAGASVRFLGWPVGGGVRPRSPAFLGGGDLNKRDPMNGLLAAWASDKCDSESDGGGVALI